LLVVILGLFPNNFHCSNAPFLINGQYNYNVFGTSFYNSSVGFPTMMVRADKRNSFMAIQLFLHQPKVILRNFAVTPRSEKPETSLFIVNYGLFLLYLQTTARNVAVQAYNENKTFHRNVYKVKHM
jgi:hypothetical protein